MIASVDLAAFLKYTVKAADDAELDFMAKLCKQVTAKINRYTGKIFNGATAFTETYDGNGTVRLLLRNIPVNSITSITENGALLAVTNYYVKVDTGVLYRKYGYWTNQPQFYVVTYNAGLAPGAAGYEDLQEAALLWASDIYVYSREKRVGVSGRSFGNQSESIYFENRGVPKRVEAILEAYKAPVRYA